MRNGRIVPIVRIAALLAFLLAFILPQADTPAVFATADHTTVNTYSVAWSGCDTVNCRSRQESGKTGWINFSQGDTVIAWRVRPEDKYDLNPHPCIWWNAPTWGKIYDGVRNPWWQEIHDAQRNGWPPC